MMNLPYVKHSEGEYVVQSNACLYYLGRRLDLMGDDDEKTRQAVDMVIAQTMDLRNAATVGCFYGANPSLTPELHVKVNVRPSYKKFNDFMEVSNTQWSASDSVTMADFHLWEMLDQHERWFQWTGVASVLSEFPKLEKLHGELKAHPKLASYFESEEAKFDVNNPHAKFIN
jgi:hypothetical protein